MEIVVRLVAGVLLAGCNAFFVATEFALTRLRQFPEEDFQDRARLKKAWEMTDRLEIYLTSCQVGITVTSILLGVVAEPAVTALLHPLFAYLPIGESSARLFSIALAVAILNLFHTVFGEQAPTYLGVERPKQVAEFCAPIHFYWTRIMSPVIRVGDYMAKALLRVFGVEMKRSWRRGEEDAQMGRSELVEEMGRMLARGQVSHDRRQEVIQALEIGRTKVSEVMIPRDGIVALHSSRSVEENLETIAQNGFVRFPLFGEDPEEFLGLVYTPGLFARLEELRKGSITLENLAAPPLEVSGEMVVSELIDKLQEAEQEAAIVREEGKIVGFITATDAFEIIIGDLEDPYD